MRKIDFGDLFAGITLWAVFSAQALAYSRLAHATPIAGLVTAVAGAIIYSLLGSSRRNSIGPAGAIAAIVGTAVSGLPPEKIAPSIAVMTTIAAGVLFLAALLRISFLPRLFPAPVFVGYLAGTGISILIGQTHDLLSGGSLALAIGIGSIVGALALKKFAPRIPGPFVILSIVTVLSAILGLPERGVPVIGNALGEFGHFSWPTSLGWGAYPAMLAPALSLALLVYVDDLANAEALMREQDPPIRPVREYLALGSVNLVSALWGGFMAGCSSSRSIVGIRAGARTRKAGLIAGILLLGSAFSLVKFIQPMPLSALAGIVWVAALDLIDTRKLREFRAFRRADFRIAALTLISVAVLGPVWGAGAGVIAAIIEVFRRAMDPHRSVFFPQKSDKYYESFGIPDATASDALLRAKKLLEQKGIHLLFGNARSEQREILAKTGSFRVIDEREFIEDLKKARKAA